MRVLKTLSPFLLALFLGGCSTVAYVPATPPSAKVEVRTARPGPRHVWVKGHWKWNGHRYVWVKGHWVKGKRNARWLAGHWKNTPRGHVWVPGHWKR
ncbi:MAG: YXWGXW repeat-containing protein [Candidatus Krumholzibacteria bacterium]|jgi:hypothetical protein|nr:YXWGXW repeat-containing protein [Candidatus Krumholzibacteria bacterium]MDP6668450.1 YXWGXW repeat-containing protein [Candidatus Krumholzibacteria bacterium]MDP6798068.1 YXWGXW repeat-containing protein [Candidatus Krumholzibacteria bacterium]MDP7021543.1 YXWGXW repeat-containing protein [Candidatus Krumholzibacteria bacterium]